MVEEKEGEIERKDESTDKRERASLSVHIFVTEILLLYLDYIYSTDYDLMIHLVLILLSRLSSIFFCT